MNIKKGITALGYTLHYLFQPRLNRHRLEDVLKTDNNQQIDSLIYFFQTDENDAWFKEFCRDALNNNQTEYYKGIIRVLNLFTTRMKGLLCDSLTLLDLQKLIQVHEYATPRVIQDYANVLLEQSNCVLPPASDMLPLLEHLYKELGSKALSTFALILHNDPSFIKDITLILLEKQAWHNFISENEINFLSRYINFETLLQNPSFTERMNAFFIQYKNNSKINKVYELLEGVHSKTIREWIMEHYEIPEYFHLIKHNMAYTYHSEGQYNQDGYKKKYEELSLYEVALGFNKHPDKNTMLLHLNQDFMDDIMAEGIHTRAVVNPFKKIPKDEFIFKI